LQEPVIQPRQQQLQPQQQLARRTQLPRGQLQQQLQELGLVQLLRWLKQQRRLQLLLFLLQLLVLLLHSQQQQQ
jgi:DNA-binding IclR family transcriptional regulator